MKGTTPTALETAEEVCADAEEVDEPPAVPPLVCETVAPVVPVVPAEPAVPGCSGRAS